MAPYGMGQVIVEKNYIGESLPLSGLDTNIS